jgi:uncharacterized protein (DUF2147 family)
MVISASPAFEEELTAAELCSGTSSTENFTSSDIPAGTTLYFSVVAYNANGLGDPSDIISKTVPGSTTTYSLDGFWKYEHGDMIITISGSTGVFTQFNNPTGLTQDALNKGYISVGSQFLRNLTKTGDRTWTGQHLEITFNTSSPNVATGTTWKNDTITLSTDGQTFQVFESGNSTPRGTFTRQ